MKKISFNSILFMIIITVIFTGALATINEVTKDRVLMNQELKSQQAMLYILDIPSPKNNAVEVSALYSNTIKEVTGENMVYYEGYRNDALAGYIFPIEGDAVWGNLKGYIGLTTDLNEVLGIYFLSHSETPGLGGRIDELQFKEQFRGITIDINDQDSNYIIYKPSANGQVDSITGATGTSNAVRRILNSNLSDILSNMKGGK